MSGAFLAADRVDELLNRGADEPRVKPAPIRRALEHRRFGEIRDPQSPNERRVRPKCLTHDAGEPTVGKKHPAP